MLCTKPYTHARLRRALPSDLTGHKAWQALYTFSDLCACLHAIGTTNGASVLLHVGQGRAACNSILGHLDGAGTRPRRA